MKSNALFARAAVIALMVLAPASAAFAQGPSLGETLDFIKGKLEVRGDLNWTVATNVTGTNQDAHLDHVLGVDTDAAGCGLTIHYTVLSKGAQALYDDHIPLGSINDVQLASWAQLNTSGYARHGHPEITAQTQPDVWTVELFAPNDATHAINFFDHSIAERVAKAFSHAAQLCGGPKPSPF